MKMPFGVHRGADVQELPDDYIAWLASLTVYTVRISETRKVRLRDAITRELQRRLDDPARGRRVANCVLPEEPQTLH